MWNRIREYPFGKYGGIMSEAIIKLSGVKKAYGDHEVLKGIDMQVNKGDIYGLVGRNGAGKTTIFKMILGLSEMNEGDVSIAGSTNRKELLKNRGKVGFMVGNKFYSYLTAKENLQYYATIKGLSDKEAKPEIDRVLGLVGLAGVKQKFKNFSLGMQQRLGIANALLGNPEVLILDEPTNGLDPQGIADIRHMVRRFNEEFGMTVIVSSHILGELEHTADRFGIINEGVVVKEFTQEDLMEKQSSIEIAVDDLERAKEALNEKGVRIVREIQEKSTLEDFYFRLVGGNKE